MKILLTKHRPDNLARHISNYLKAFHEVHHLPAFVDIRHIEDQSIPQDTQVLINCAGVTDMHPLQEWTHDDITHVISNNLVGAITLTNAFVRRTIDQPGRKVIIHIGSLWSRKCATCGSVYSASKAGLAQYVACAGYELRTKGYNVIGLHPGNILGTGMTAEVQRNLMERRGMTQSTIAAIYAEAIEPIVVAQAIKSLIECDRLTGENIYLGDGDHR